MPTAARPRRSRAGLIVFVALLALAAWKVSEWLVIGGAPDPGKLAFRPLPYVMYGLVPDFERQGEPQRSSNTHGFRGPDVAVPKPEGTYRIACLGGSTTYSNKVADDETYPRQLEAVLAAARPDLDVEVVNAGVVSYTTAESLANLAFRVLELEPDMAVVYHAANDVRPRRYRNFTPSYDHYRRVWSGRTDDVTPPGGDDPILSELGGINLFIQKLPPEDNGELSANVRAAGPVAFRRNLVSIVGLARAHGIEPVLVTFAASDATTLPDMRVGLAEHNDVIRAVCAEQDVACVELDPVPLQPHFVDSVHLDAGGCRLKAERIGEAIVPLLP